MYYVGNMDYQNEAKNSRYLNRNGEFIGGYDESGKYVYMKGGTGYKISSQEIKQEAAGEFFKIWF